MIAAASDAAPMRPRWRFWKGGRQALNFDAMLYKELAPGQAVEELTCIGRPWARGVKQLAVALREGRGPVRVSIQAKFRSDEAECLAEALAFAPRLQQFMLKDPSWPERATLKLADALKVNCKLLSLQLGKTPLGPSGAALLADALAAHPTLVDLGLGENQIGCKGAEAIGMLLARNHVWPLVPAGATKRLLRKLRPRPRPQLPTFSPVLRTMALTPMVSGL